MFQRLLLRVLLTWSLFSVGSLTTLSPNLGIIHRVSPPFSKCIQRKGVTFWVPTHAPQPLVTRPGSVSTFLSYHARGSPLGVALSWVISVPGSPSGGVGTSRVRLPPTGTRAMALKPPFSSLYYCSEVLRPLAVSPPPRSFLPMGIGGWHRRCLNLAMPTPGDASS